MVKNPGDNFPDGGGESTAEPRRKRGFFRWQALRLRGPCPCGQTMLNQAQQQLVNLNALKTLEGMVAGMDGE
jgi:hypothetical protein